MYGLLPRCQNPANGELATVKLIVLRAKPTVISKVASTIAFD
jgi:hypothetical protein